MNLFDLVATLSLDSSDFDKGLSSAKTAMSSLGTGIKKGLAAAHTAVVGFGKSAVTAGLQFDTSMSQVAATMGKSTDEIKDLREFAKKMGSETAFSASEAADALNYMALAGYNSKTSMKMLPNVLNLAAAGSIDLAEASDMVTDAQSALGLKLDETSELVDKMAKASSKTNTSVAQLGEAMLTVGGTAKNLKGGTTELSVALGLLADNGIKGAEGGTALRNIILSLSAPTDSAAKALKALGVEVFDEQGNMRDLESIFADLDARLSTMSQGEQTQVLSKIFNKVDLKSVNALLGTSADRWDEVTTEINNATGAAQKMADTQLDNLNGNITIFQSALEGAQIEISERLTPTLNDFVKIGTQGLSDITAGLKSGGVQGASTALGNFLAEGITVITDKIPVFIEAGSNLIEALLDGINSNMTKIVNGAENILTQFVQGLGRNLPKLRECAINLLQTMIDAILASLPEFISIGTQIFTELLNSITTNLPELIQAGTQAIVQLSKGLSEAIPTLVPVVKESIIQIAKILTSSDSLSQLLDAGLELFQAVLEGLLEASGALIPSLGDVITTIIEFLVNSIPELIQAGTDIITAVIDAFPGIIAELLKTAIIENIINTLLESLPQIIEAGIQLLTALVDGLPIVITNIIEAIPTIIDGIISAILGNLPQIIDAGVQLLTSLVGNLSEIISKIVAVLPELIKNILTTLISFIPDLIAAGIQLFVALISALPTIISSIAEAIPDIIDAVIDTLMDAIPLIIDAGIELFIALVDNLPAIITGIVNAIPKIIVSITSKIGDLIPKLVKAGVDLFVAIVKDLPKITATIVSKIPEIVTSIVSGFSSLTTQMWTVGENMLKGLWDGISGAAGWLWEQISNWAGGLWDGICDFFGIHSPSTLFRDGLGKNMALGLGQGFVKAMDDVNKDMVNAIPTDFDVSPNVDVNSSYSAVGTGGISGNFSPVSLGQGVHISLNIENFNNYTDDDIDDLTDRLITSISEKMSRRGAVYA